MLRWAACAAGLLGSQLTPLAAQTEPPTAEAVNRAPQKEVSVDPKARDTEIADRLTRILQATEWFGAFSVSVREGVAFLDGVTESEARRDWAGQLAGNTQDVVAVVNRMDVQPKIQWDLTPAWTETRKLAFQAQKLLPVLILGGIILVITWFLTRGAAWVARWMFRDRVASPLLLTVASRALAIPVFLLGLYVVLQVSGLTRLALTVLGGTGVLGIVIGFAFRDIAENFLASLLLSLRNPFRAGDLIEVGDYRGIVQNLNTRSTVLLTQDGNHIQIPNAMVFKSIITNFSSSPARRADFLVGIGYEDSISEAQRVIVAALSRHPAVRADPEPMALVDELGSSTVNLRVYFWFDGAVYSPIKLSSALMRQVKRTLLEAGISMPDAAREVIFPQGLPIYRAPAFSSTIARPEPAASGPATAGHPAVESPASPGEGDLTSDDDDVQRQAGSSPLPEAEENLLEDGTGAKLRFGPTGPGADDTKN